MARITEEVRIVEEEETFKNDPQPWDVAEADVELVGPHSELNTFGDNSIDRAYINREMWLRAVLEKMDKEEQKEAKKEDKAFEDSKDYSATAAVSLEQRRCINPKVGFGGGVNSGYFCGSDDKNSQ